MQIETLLGGFDRNLTYVVACATSGRAFAVDAAVPAGEILAAAGRLGATLELLVLTHSHADHTVSAAELLRQRDGLRLAAFGREAAGLAPAGRYDELADGAKLQVGEIELRVLHTPGHHHDSICLIAGSALFSGDTLFVGRTGRTIGARSDTRALYRSLRDKLLPLPDELVLHPGHDYGASQVSTLGEERRTNPFLQAGSEEEFVRIMADYEKSRT